MNSVHEMENRINKYIKDKDTDYAILLNGKWGCGKTYYIKEWKNRKEKEEKNLKIIYYSLNGIVEVKSVIRHLMISIYSEVSSNNDIGNFFNKVLNKIQDEDVKKINNILEKIAVAGNIVTDYVAEKNLRSVLEKNTIVLILDDLERISAKVDITDLLGDIHSKFIDSGAKVVFIADELEIENDQKNKFDKEKEKYILHTIPFAIDEEEVVNKIWEKTIKNKPISNEEMGSLVKVFFEEQINLRTVKYSLNLYREIIEYCRECLNDEKKFKNPETLLFSICAYAKFYKQESVDLKKLCVHNINLMTKNNTYNNEDNDKYYNFIEEYNKHGILLQDDFIVKFAFGYALEKHELENFLAKREKDSEPLFDLTNYKMLETHEVKKLIDQIYINLNNKKYSIRNMVQIRDLFIPLAQKFGILDKDETEQKVFDSVFDASHEKELQDMFTYVAKDGISLLPKFSEKFDKELDKQYKLFLSGLDKTFVEKFYEYLQNTNFLDTDIIHQTEIHSIFTRLQQQNYFEKILVMPNKSIQFFADYIRYKISNLSNASEFYFNEISALQDLKTVCENESNEIKEKDFIKSENLDYLVSAIDEAIKHIQSLN